MRFSNILNVLFFFFLLAAVSCTDPLENVVEYNLGINNQTDTEYEVFQSSGAITGGAYINVGTLGPMNSITLRKLIVDVPYSFRLTQGDNPDVYDYQQTIQSAGDNITWNVP